MFNWLRKVCKFKRDGKTKGEETFEVKDISNWDRDTLEEFQKLGRKLEGRVSDGQEIYETLAEETYRSPEVQSIPIYCGNPFRKEGYITYENLHRVKGNSHSGSRYTEQARIREYYFKRSLEIEGVRDRVQCVICGKHLEEINCAHLSTHGVPLETYKEFVCKLNRVSREDIILMTPKRYAKMVNGKKRCCGKCEGTCHKKERDDV